MVSMNPFEQTGESCVSLEGTQRSASKKSRKMPLHALTKRRRGVKARVGKLMFPTSGRLIDETLVWNSVGEGLVSTEIGSDPVLNNNECTTDFKKEASQPVPEEVEVDPLADTGKRRAEGQSSIDIEGGGGGSNSGGPKRPDSSGKLESMVAPSPVLQAVVRECKARNVSVECPVMLDSSEVMSAFRKHHFRGDDIKRMYDIQNSDLMDEAVFEDGHAWYSFLALHNLYKAGRISLENAEILLRMIVDHARSKDPNNPKFFKGIEYIFARFKKLADGNFIPETNDEGQVIQGIVLEMCAGNGDLIIRSRKFKDVHRWSHKMDHHFATGKRPNKTSVREILDTHKRESSTMIDKGTIDPKIKAVDYVQTTVNKLRNKRKIDARCADVCADPEDYFKQAGYAPGEVDVFFFNLGGDRIPDYVKFTDNMRYSARPDGSSRALMGFLVPFETDSDVVSKNENVKNIPFWNRDGDIREHFMKDVEVMEAFKELEEEHGPDAALRAQIIFNMIMRHNELGIVVQNVAELPYEVYSPHCIMEPAGVIRTDEKYAYLQDVEFDDPAIQKIIDGVFNDPELFPDDRKVGVPQRYKLVVLGCQVLPKNGLRFANQEES